MIESDSERPIAVTGGKVTPRPTVGGKSLPLDSDSFLKRIDYVITYHAPCRHARPAGCESAPSWPWRPWPQKGLGVGSHFHFQFHEHRGDSHCGWDCAKPSWQLVQFAAAGHRRHTLGSGHESGGIGDQCGPRFPGVWFRSRRVGGRRSPQDQCYGLILKIADSSFELLRAEGLARALFIAVRPQDRDWPYRAGERGPGRRLERPGWRPNIGRRTDSPRQQTGYAPRPSWVP